MFGFAWFVSLLVFQKPPLGVEPFLSCYAIQVSNVSVPCIREDTEAIREADTLGGTHIYISDTSLFVWIV